MYVLVYVRVHNRCKITNNFLINQKNVFKKGENRARRIVFRPRLRCRLAAAVCQDFSEKAAEKSLSQSQASLPMAHFPTRWKTKPQKQNSSNRLFLNKFDKPQSSNINPQTSKVGEFAR